jgi:hypothetical protein
MLLTLIQNSTPQQEPPKQTKPAQKPTTAQLVEALLALLEADGLTQIERVKIDVAPVMSSLMLADPVTGQSKPAIVGRKAGLVLLFHESNAPRDAHKYKLAVERLKRYGIEGSEQSRV